MLTAASTMPVKEEWSHFTPFDARRVSWKQYEQDVLSYGEGVTDDSGSNLAETLIDADMGGAAPGAAPMPVILAAVAAAAGGPPAALLLDISKMQRLRTARLGQAYKLLYQSISDTDMYGLLRICSA